MTSHSLINHGHHLLVPAKWIVGTKPKSMTRELRWSRKSSGKVFGRGCNKQRSLMMLIAFHAIFVVIVFVAQISGCKEWCCCWKICCLNDCLRNFRSFPCCCSETSASLIRTERQRRIQLWRWGTKWMDVRLKYQIYEWMNECVMIERMNEWIH